MLVLLDRESREQLGVVERKSGLTAVQTSPA